METGRICKKLSEQSAGVRQKVLEKKRKMHLMCPFLALITEMLMCAKLFQSCLTLCDPVDCGLPGSSVHVISQARILKWVATSSSRGSSQPRDPTHISYIGRWVLYH